VWRPGSPTDCTGYWISPMPNERAADRAYDSPASVCEFQGYEARNRDGEVELPATDRVLGGWEPPDNSGRFLPAHCLLDQPDRSVAACFDRNNGCRERWARRGGCCAA
jgi:hypothetical protein